MSKFISIPDKIKICGQIYNIEFINELLLEDCVGKTIWRKSVIYLSDDLDECQAQITLLHEILHCIHEVTHFAVLNDDDSNDDKEEMIVRRLDVALHQVLKDNNIYFGERK